jgi:WD40 repeat protein
MQPICQNAAHIYISALPFTPSHSLVSQHYLPRYPHTLSVKGGPKTWDDSELHERPVIGSVDGACISFDGTRIAAIFHDGTLCIYDTTTTGEAILPPFKVDENPRSVIFSRDGKLVATGGQALRLWNVQTGEEVESFDINVYSLALSPDGTCIAAGCAGMNFGTDGRGRGSYNNIRVINLELAKISHPYVPPGKEGIMLLKGEIWLSPFEGHEGHVYSVAYSADSEQIASSSDDETVRVWDVSTGSRRTFQADSGVISSVSFSPDGTQIVAGLTLINLSTGSSTRLGEQEQTVLSSAFSADGRFIASGTSYPAACQIWDVSTRQAIVQLIGHTDNVYSVSFFPDGKQIMSASWDGTIRVWDIELLEEREEMDRWQVKSDLDRIWICGPEGEHLFWPQLPFRHTRNTLVIGECPKIDFSNFVHGDEWVKCQEPL